MSGLAGCTLTPIEAGACAALVQWAAGDAPMPDPSCDTLLWLLAHCDGGVVWGRRDSGGAWIRSDDAFPGISPRIEVARLQELRLFGPREERLVCNDGELLYGRILADGPPAADPLSAIDDQRVLIGDRRKGASVNGFTRVEDAGGSRQAVPLDCPEAVFWQYSRAGQQGRRHEYSPLRLDLRHFLTQEPTTGAVRVAATRLVGLRVEPAER